MSKCAAGIVRFSTRSIVGIGDQRVDVHRPQAELRGAARGRVRVDVGAGGDLDAAEQRRIAQIGHRDVAASDDADPQSRALSCVMTRLPCA